MFRALPLLLLGAAAALHAPALGRPRAGVLRCIATTSTSGLYAKMEAVLRRARKEPTTLGARTAQGLSQRWTTMEPTDLLEATLVSGRLVLSGFDEVWSRARALPSAQGRVTERARPPSLAALAAQGLELLLEAEDAADLAVGGRAYAALMRLGQSEGRPSDVLALLARARARGVPRSDGALLNGMCAASELADWGAVARLYEEIECGDEECAVDAAIELETISLSPEAAGRPTHSGLPTPCTLPRCTLLTLAHRVWHRRRTRSCRCARSWPRRPSRVRRRRRRSPLRCSLSLCAPTASAET